MWIQNIRNTQGKYIYSSAKLEILVLCLSIYNILEANSVAQLLLCHIYWITLVTLQIACQVLFCVGDCHFYQSLYKYSKHVK